MAIRVQSERGGPVASIKVAFLSTGYIAGLGVPGALASDPTECKVGSDLTNQHAAFTHHYSVSNDRACVEVAAHDSDVLGQGLISAVDGHLADAMAPTFGYGENRRE